MAEVEEVEKEGGGITLGYIFRTIFSQRWLALIIAAAITIIGTLGLYFLGKRNEVYSVSFVLQLPNTGDVTSTSYTYPDGESFYYTDFKLSSNLEKIASREGFEDIDVEKMVRKGDIDIYRTVDKVEINSTEGVYDLNYTIKIKASYFKNENKAREFIQQLVSIPREHISAMNINYDKGLTSSKSAITYEEQLTRLKNQAVYIQEEYAGLTSAYGEEFVVDGGKTLASCKKELDDFIEKGLFSSLLAVADKNGYVKSTEAEYQYRTKLAEIKEQLELAENTRDQLREFAKEGTIIYDEIITISKEIATLTQQRDYMQAYVDACENGTKPPKDFTDEIEKVELAVTEFTNGIQPVASYVYGKVTKVNFLSTKVVELEGGRGLVMSVVISLVVGLVVAAIVAYIVGWNKQRKPVSSQSVAAPVYGEAQLQAAVTDETAAADGNKEDKNNKK